MRHVIETFEGFVLSVDDEKFWCRVEDLDGDEYEMELITDKITFGSEEDKDWIAEGAPFVWTLFSDDSHSFVFWKEVWTEEQIADAEKRAEELIAQLKEIGFCDVD